MTSLAPPTHWDFSIRLLKLNVWVAVKMSWFKNPRPLFQSTMCDLFQKNSFHDIVNLGSIWKCRFNSVVGSVVRLSGHSESEHSGHLPEIFRIQFQIIRVFHNSIKTSSTFGFRSTLSFLLIDGSVRSTLIKIDKNTNFKRKWPITVSILLVNNRRQSKILAEDLHCARSKLDYVVPSRSV